MKFTRFIILTMAILSFGLNVFAVSNNNKGIQAVLLQRWSATSVQNFLNVFCNGSIVNGVCSGSYTAGPSRVEIAFAPNPLPGLANNSASDSYKNMRTIINALTGAGKRVVVTSHLSFHAANSSSNTQIMDGAAEFNDLVTLYANNSLAAFNVSPSLEDTASISTYNAWAGIIAGQISSSLIGKVNLRRSSNNSSQMPSSSCFGGKCFRSLQYENHGVLSRAVGTYAYSNDGCFVFSSADGETANSINNIPSGCSGIEINNFNTNNSNQVLLWRPAYNLWTWNSNVRQWIKPDSSTTRRDSPVRFDGREQRVLKQFLGIS